MTPLLALLPGCPGLRIDDLVLTPTAAVALVASTASAVACPRCGASTNRLRSHYRRAVADLPCQGRPVALRLVVRRFRCSQPGCPRAVFCERLPGLLEPHARSTARLAGAHRAIGLALGGEAGSRLANRLDMPTSPDTLLRRVKNSPAEGNPPPRYVGVDDWAMRKGRRYGTILVDLERGRVIDLSPGRDGAALKVWLNEHPSVEVITRDRWAAYAQAAAEGAPQARQVADRWHLLKNLREAVEHLLARMFGAVHEALRNAPRSDDGAPPASVAAEADGQPSGIAPSAAAAPFGSPGREAAFRAKTSTRKEAAAASPGVRAGPGVPRRGLFPPGDRTGGRRLGQAGHPLPAHGSAPRLESGTSSADATGPVRRPGGRLDHARGAERGRVVS